MLVHGGPGAQGSLAGLARELAESHRVIEHLQRRSGGEPLTVERHVEDLRASLALEESLTIVGHSWGAMLALAYAARYPDALGALVLVGCGTFDEASRTRMKATQAERMDDALRTRLSELDRGMDDEQLRELGNLFFRLDSHSPIVSEVEGEAFDARGNRESWADMLRQQENHVYPESFAAIEVPVLMLHGDYDSHPGALIASHLRNHIPHLEYAELSRCGHYPWLEEHGRAPFLERLSTFLRERA